MKVSKNQNQNAGFHFFLFEQKTMKLGISKSDCIHNCILYGSAVKKIFCSYEKADRIIYEMIRIGNNISQIAHFVNMEHTFEPKDFERI